MKPSMDINTYGERLGENECGAPERKKVDARRKMTNGV
jgi:hypothetical protein